VYTAFETERDAYLISSCDEFCEDIPKAVYKDKVGLRVIIELPKYTCFAGPQAAAEFLRLVQTALPDLPTDHKGEGGGGRGERGD
jgi:hypothetical protein